MALGGRGGLIGCWRVPARGDLLASGKRIISGFFLRFVLLTLSFAEDGGGSLEVLVFRRQV